MHLQQAIATRIEQYLPDLRRQTRQQIRTQLQKTNKQILQQKTNQVREFYTNKLQQKANSIKQNINANISQIGKSLKNVQNDISSIKNRKLTASEKEQLILDTVDGILEDEKMVQEIKMKLYPKVQENVFKRLQENLQEELKHFQNGIMDKVTNEREDWEKGRWIFWRAESEREIQVLAEEHKDLELKKGLIQESLATKKAQRDALLRQQNQLTQSNNQISYLKTQIKLLS